MVERKKVIWITGASSGIGRETAHHFARHGWIVAASARSEDELKALQKENANIKPYPCDITKRDMLFEVVKKIASEQGQIDIALLNAGTYKPDDLDNWDLEAFDTQIDLNIKGTIGCVAALLPVLKEQGHGHIAFVASVAGYRGLPRSVAYGGSKAALNNMAESLRLELQKYNIRVQVINPGFVKTPLTDKNDFEMPMRISVKKAAEHIYKGLHSNNFEVYFPKTFAIMLKMIGLLPDPLYFKLISKQTQKIDKD